MKISKLGIIIHQFKYLLTGCYTNTVTLTKAITVGPTVSGYYNVSSNYVVSNNNTLDYGGGSVFLPPNQSVLFSNHITTSGLSSVTWSVSGIYSSYSSGSNYLNLYMNSPSSAYTSNNATITLNANGSCGAINKSYNFQVVAQNPYSITASPNPAKGNINLSISKTEKNNSTIKLPNTTTKEPGFTKFYLYDFNTNILVKQWSYQENNAKHYSLNVAELKRGVYVLKFNRDNTLVTTKIVLE